MLSGKPYLITNC